MSGLEIITAWGVSALVSAVACGFLAQSKDRNVSAWIAWGFLLPPTVLVLLMLKKRKDFHSRKSLEEEERDFHRG